MSPTMNSVTFFLMAGILEVEEIMNTRRHSPSTVSQVLGEVEASPSFIHFTTFLTASEKSWGGGGGGGGGWALLNVHVWLHVSERIMSCACEVHGNVHFHVSSG